MWYREVIGRGRCPIVDTWWQTETGAIMITPLPGAIATKPGSATLPLPGIIADVVNREGQSRAAGLGRISGDQTALAFHVADHLRRSGALQGAILVADSGHVFRRRRRAHRFRTAISG